MPGGMTRHDEAAVVVSGTIDSRDTWRIALQSDVTANDSDKTFVVPAADEHQIFWIWVELTTTATVGDRQLVIEVIKKLTISSL